MDPDTLDLVTIGTADEMFGHLYIVGRKGLSVSIDAPVVIDHVPVLETLREPSFGLVLQWKRLIST